MSFSASWHTLLEELEDLSDRATLITPLSHDRFRITGVQEHRVVIGLEDKHEKRPLQRDQFETLYRRIQDALDGFELDRLPPDADPYPAVLSVHPRFEVDEEVGIITETDEPTTTQLIEADPEDKERSEPDGLDIHSGALLLIDALERHDVTALSELDTEALVNLYTLLSDVQRDARRPPGGCRRPPESPTPRPPGFWAVRVSPADESTQPLTQRRGGSAVTSRRYRNRP